MAVIIKTIHQMNIEPDKHLGTICHHGQLIDVVLVGQYDHLRELLDQEVTAEYELNEIISVQINLERADGQSGIFPCENQYVLIDGFVHQVLEIDDKVSLVDIYIQNGAEFLGFSTEELESKPALGSRIKILGKGLHVYPTFT